LLPNTNAAANDVPQLAPIGNGMGMPDGLPNGIGVGDGHEPSVTVAPTKAPVASIHVSTGVFKGMLLAPILPVYPAIAKAAHVEGAVVVEAVISRKGTIESLHVVSGPQMLQNAALDAIRAARYQPYRLNGEPTEVQTTITVNFRIGG
jgi:protein TonB